MRTPGTPLLLLLALTGCPPTPGPTPPPSTDAAPVPSAGPATVTEPPKDPLAGSIFTKEQVLAIFRAEYAAGLPDAKPEAKAERDQVLLQHGLIEADGDEVPARVGAYERAVEALAKDSERWAEFVETLPR